MKKYPAAVTQDRGRGGVGDADEPGSACAEDVAGAECNAGVVEEHLCRSGQVADYTGSVLRGGRVQTELSAVQPGQVGRLRAHQVDERQVRVHQRHKQAAVVVETLEEGVQPVAAVGEGGGVGED